MSLQLLTEYDTPANFTYDTAKVEVAGGKAQLKLAFFPEEDFSEDFADDTGHTYNSSLLEFIGGVVRQKDQTVATSILAAKYASSINLNWNKGAGGTTGVASSGATVTAGKLDCTGITSKGVYYTTVNNSTLTLKFKYTPNYSTPSTNLNMIAIREPTGSNNRLALTHSPTGDNFRITLHNSSGTGIYTAQTIGASSVGLVSGTEYEMALTFAASTGVVRLFINGTLHGTLTAGAVAWVNNTARVYVGANPAIYDTANANFDDVMYFSSVLYTASYIPGYTPVDLVYAEGSNTLPVFTYSGPGLLKPASPPTSTEAGTPRYIIQGKYWDGDSWEDSDGSYAQATSKGDILANIGTFPSTGLSTVTVIVVFGASNTQSSVDQIDFAIQGQGYAQDNPTIRPNGFTQVDGLDDFAATLTAVDPDAVKFALETRLVSGGPSTYYYWNGSAWVVADGTYAQSNTAAELAANFPSLDLSTGRYARIVVFLHSDDGYSTPDIEDSTLDYNFFITPAAPKKVIIYGWLREPDGSILTGTVTLQNLKAFEHTGLLVPKSQVSVDTDADGYWEMEVYETETIGKTYKIILEYAEDFGTPASYTIEVPNQDSANLTDMIAA